MIHPWLFFYYFFLFVPALETFPFFYFLLSVKCFSSRLLLCSNNSGIFFTLWSKKKMWSLSLPFFSVAYIASSLFGSGCEGGVHPEYDPNPGPVGDVAQLPGRGLLPARQPLHRPLLLRQSLPACAPRTDLCGRQIDQQSEERRTLTPTLTCAHIDAYT